MSAEVKKVEESVENEKQNQLLDLASNKLQNAMLELEKFRKTSNFDILQSLDVKPTSVNSNKEIGSKLNQLANASKFQSNTTGIISSYLTMKELRNFVTSKHLQTLLTIPMDKKRKKIAELISIVLNDPSCKKIQEWIENNKKDDSVALSLIKTNGREQYFSKQQNKMICKREWMGISALQGAGYCGDNFIVIIILSHILKKEAQTKDPTLRLEAAKQLAEVLENIKYLISFKELINAYILYFEYYDKLYSANDLSEDERAKGWGEWNELWKKVINTQKGLSVYGLQEFCDPTPFFPLPNFKTEPNRDELRLIDEDDAIFDIDTLGKESMEREFEGDDTETPSFHGLLKGAGKGAFMEMESAIARQDLLAFQHLCKIRTDELREIIKALQSYDESILLINKYLDKQDKTLSNKL